MYLFLHDFWFHVRDDSDGEFADNSLGDDGFASGLGESALDAVERKRWMAPSMHQRLHLVIAVN